MRFTTIWDPRINFSFRERLRRTGEWFWCEAARRLPKRLAYWSYIHTGAQHIANNETVPEVTYTDILQRLHHKDHAA